MVLNIDIKPRKSASPFVIFNVDLPNLSLGDKGSTLYILTPVSVQQAKQAETRQTFVTDTSNDTIYSGQ